MVKRLGRMVGVATELGVTMGLMAAGLVILGLWLGRRLDSSLGTGPLATILFALASAVAGQIAIYRLAVRSARRLSADAENVLPRREVLSSIGLGLRILALMVLPGVLGLGLGLWIDRGLDTGAVATLILALGGTAAGFAASLRLARSQSIRPNPGSEEACSDSTRD